jgi:hypothetical protein
MVVLTITKETSKLYRSQLGFAIKFQEKRIEDHAAEAS